MSEESPNSVLRKNVPEVPATKDVAISACTSTIQQDEQTSSSKMDTTTNPNWVYTLKNFMTEIQSYVLSSEDDILLRYANEELSATVKRDPMCVLVDASCVSNPSSVELLADTEQNFPEYDLKTFIDKSEMLEDLPSTSKGLGTDILTPDQLQTDANDEMQIVDINLQSDHDIILSEDSVTEENSIVISYIRNRDSLTNTAEGTLNANKKKQSLLETVRKMETILEGENSGSTKTENSTKRDELREVSDTSLDIKIPSFPGSPRSFNNPFGNDDSSIGSFEESKTNRMKAIEFLHADNDFLIAVESGNNYLVDLMLKKGTNPHQVDHLGRNALHIAVSNGKKDVIHQILNAGVDPNVKDALGMTPLYICLMRRPLLSVANMLFKYGAVILPRISPMDTGLFIQFIMMCTPTLEEELIIELLVRKGALIDDPDAPGGRQALHFAAMSDNCKLINILVDLGADLFLTNHRNETPREVAFSFQCREAASLLGELEEEYMLRLGGLISE